MADDSKTLIMKEPRQSAVWMLTVLAVSVFIIEVMVMVLLPSLPPMSETARAMIDAAMLSLFLFPIFYFLVFRPLIVNITERRMAEEALRESEMRFRRMADHAPALIWLSDTRNMGIWYNKHWLDYTGRSMGQELGFGWLEGMHPEDRARSAAFCQTSFDARKKFEMEFRLRRADGKYAWIADVGVPRFDDSGEFLGYIGYCWDINSRKATEARLQLAANVFTHAREGILIADADGAIIDVNDTFTRITGYGREEVLGKNPRILQSGRQPPEFYTAMWHELLENGHWTGEMWNRRKSGEVFAEMLTISAVYAADKVIQNYVALFTDITSMKEHQRELEHIAHFDALTGLPNRILLGDRLHQAMAQSQRRNQPLAVVFVDLDGFKTVNDTHGHKIGDELLIIVSQRMRSVLREGDTLARIGGDEFVAVLVDLEMPQDWQQLISRLLEAASAPVQISDFEVNVSASIGVTLYPEDYSDADILMRHADQAMYLAKQAGKNCYRLFDAGR
ncbi:MAG: diguanylate cyclase [Sideroxydans sp.]|nr:diguanylate cyclase [Sideroxydans sp.]